MNFSSELLNKGNKTPAFSISIEGKDITTVLDNRLMGLTLTDNRGFEADQLDLELDDADGTHWRTGSPDYPGAKC